MGKICEKAGLSMMDDDEELMREINRQADRAEEMRPARIDRYALAVTLAGRFQQHSAEEIEVLLTGVWRERRLGWQSTKPR
jgi:hypothetical protein